MTETHSGLDRLAVHVCRTVRDVRQDHEAWIGIDRVQSRFDVEWPDLGRAGTVDAAIAFAAAKGWLRIAGAPASLVLLGPDAP